MNDKWYMKDGQHLSGPESGRAARAEVWKRIVKRLREGNPSQSDMEFMERSSAPLDSLNAAIKRGASKSR